MRAGHYREGGRNRSQDDDASFMRPGSGEGVLRRQLPLWLSQEPLRSKVFALEEAHQKHGGGGAYYVFLRRR